MFEPMKFDGTCGTCRFGIFADRRYMGSCGLVERSAPRHPEQLCIQFTKRAQAIAAQCPADLVPVERGLLEEAIESTVVEWADEYGVGGTSSVVEELKARIRALLDQSQSQEGGEQG